MPTVRNRWRLAALLAAALLTTLACTIVSTTTPEPPSAESLALTASPSPIATATRFPTATRRPAATATTSGSPTPVVVRGLAALSVATPQAGQVFRVAITAAELNESLSFSDLNVEGATIGDPTITLVEGAIVAQFPVTVTSPAMVLDVILRGKPNVVDGALYVTVEDVSLGEGTGFFARLVAQPMVDTAIREYSGEDGIPIPLNMPENLGLRTATVASGELSLEVVARERAR